MPNVVPARISRNSIEICAHRKKAKRKADKWPQVPVFPLLAKYIELLFDIGRCEMRPGGSRVPFNFCARDLIEARIGRDHLVHHELDQQIHQKDSCERQDPGWPLPDRVERVRRMENNTCKLL
jgi:hypothetical protein